MVKFAIPLTNITAFAVHHFGNMKIRVYISIFMVFMATLAYSRPARPGKTTFVQPDGTTFIGKCIGDEFMKLRTTIDGNAIIQDSEGWWCYAEFDSEGARTSTGYRVGKDTPSSILSSSRNIPYTKLYAIASEMRSTGRRSDMKPLLKRTASADDAITKAESRPVKHGLVILAQYKDVDFKHDRDHFVNMLTQKGYTYNNATGSAKEYFDAQFGGLVDFSFDVSEIITLTNNREYYGGNDRNEQDQRPAEMIIDACSLADDNIDFSLYDDDDDGYVDNVFVFFAGGDEAENEDHPEYIWSHAWYIESGAGETLTLDGKKIDSYACTAELTFNGRTNVLAGIGTFCHEYSHTFGLPDFYDTDYDENGWTFGLWLWTSLMDGGNMNGNGHTPPYFNAIERELLGIAEPTIINDDGVYTIEPIHHNNQFYRINTNTEGEYYLIECRERTGWDTYIGGSGILVYHIDRSKDPLDRWTIHNTVNAYSDYLCADIVEADGRLDVAQNDEDFYSKVQNIQGIFFPNVATEKISLSPKVSMINIKKADKESCYTFNIIGFSNESIPPTIKNIAVEVFMDAAIINFESSKPYDGEASVTWRKAGEPEKEISVKPYEKGKYSLTLEGLVPGNKTYTVDIQFEKNGITGEKSSTSFMTSRAPSVDWPYIYLGKKAAGKGTFKAGSKIAPRVYNASKAEAITWEFNGKEITAEGDGYYTVNESGTLKTRVYWNDGETDTLEKTITITE